MNWQAVKAAPGQFVTLQVVVTEIKHVDGQYGAYGLGKAQDGPGEVIDCMFTVAKDKVLPPDLAAGHMINGAGKWDANTSRMKFYFNSFAQQQAPPPAQQQAPSPAPIPNAYAGPSPTPSPAASVVAPVAKVKKETDWGAKELREHRGYALHDACLVLVSLAELNKNTGVLHPEGAIQMAETFLKYRYNGPPAPTGPVPNPQWVGEDPPPPGDDDIPF